MVNVMLWFIPGILPLIYFITLEILKDLAQISFVAYQRSKYYPTIRFMEDNAIYFFYFNLVFVFITMLLLSSKIKNWRGLAEN